MMSLSDDYQANIIDAFNTISRYLDDILHINNVYFDNMVRQILQLYKTYTSDTVATYWTCICPCLMILFLPKFTLSVTTLIFKLSISHF